MEKEIKCDFMVVFTTQTCHHIKCNVYSTGGLHFRKHHFLIKKKIKILLDKSANSN